MTNDQTPPGTQTWHTEQPAHELTVDPTTAPANGHGIVVLARDLAARLAGRTRTSTAATGIVVRSNANPLPRLRWDTITITIGEHECVFLATADPFVPSEKVWTIYVDGRDTPYHMTHARPLADVLADAAAGSLHPAARP